MQLNPVNALMNTYRLKSLGKWQWILTVTVTLVCIALPPLSSPSVSSGFNPASTSLTAGPPGGPQGLRTSLSTAPPLLSPVLTIDSCLDSAAAWFWAGRPRRPQELLGHRLRCWSCPWPFFSFYPFKNLKKVLFIWPVIAQYSQLTCLFPTKL